MTAFPKPLSLLLAVALAAFAWVSPLGATGGASNEVECDDGTIADYANGEVCCNPQDGGSTTMKPVGECCGGDLGTVFDPNTEECCDDDTVAGSGEVCCRDIGDDHNFPDYTAETTATASGDCCGGVLITAAVECCGGSEYFVDQGPYTLDCCNDDVTYITSPSDDAQECCDDGPTQPFTDEICCDDGGTTTAVDEDDCCGGGVYDSSTEACCDDDGTPIVVPTDECCGGDGGNYFDESAGEECCGDDSVAGSGEVCCDDGGTTTAVDEDDCCGGVVLQSDEECCGDDTIAGSGEICCDDGEGNTSAMSQSDCCDTYPVTLTGPTEALCEGEGFDTSVSGGAGPFTYSSSDSSVVSVDADGHIEGADFSGSADITVTDENGCTDTITVEVTDKPYCVEEPSAGTLTASGSITLAVGDTYSFNETDVTVIGEPDCGKLKDACDPFNDPDEIDTFYKLDCSDYEVDGGTFNATQAGDFEMAIYAEIGRFSTCIEDNGGADTVTVKIGDLDITVCDNPSISITSPTTGTSVPVGTSVSFSANLSSEEGNDPTWSFGGSSTTETHTFSTADQETVTVSYSDCGGSDSDSVTINVVEVKELSCTLNGVTVTSTTDSPGADETVFVTPANAGDTITITASPNPSTASWPTDPSQTPVWTEATATPGNPSTATVPADTVLSSGSVTVEAACGTSTKKIKFVKLVLSEVSFDGSKYHQLKSDDGATIYSAPHWSDANGDGDAADSGDKNYSVAYTRDSTPKIGAKLKLGTSVSGASINVKATGTGSVAIPATNASISGTNVTLSATPSSGEFVNTIKFYDHNISGKEFELAWEMQIGNSGWFSVGETTHTVYLTLDDPATTLRQETLFYLSCKNADGLSGISSAVNAIWNEFSEAIDLEVYDVDGDILTYWGGYASQPNPPSDCFTTSGLLANNDGRCGAWARFYRDIHLVHGISGFTVRGIVTKALSSTWSGYAFYVKNWDLSTNPPTDLHGVGAQGNDDPQAAFADHAVVEYNGIIYDPSYGKKFNSLADWESASLDALLYRNNSTGQIIISPNDNTLRQRNGVGPMFHVFACKATQWGRPNVSCFCLQRMYSDGKVPCHGA